MRHRYTIRELRDWGDIQVLYQVIQDRLSTCTNSYSPLSIRLNEIKGKMFRQEQLTDVTSKKK